MSELAQCLIAQFGQVSSAFRAFDKRKRGSVYFCDFASVVEKLKTHGFSENRDTIMQIFTYLDTDRDNMLRYPDFCNLCSEAIPAVSNSKQDLLSQSDVISSRKASSNSDFSKMIVKLKKKKINDRRGGPNFKNRNPQQQSRRINSASGNAYSANRTVDGVSAMSPEL